MGEVREELAAAKDKTVQSKKQLEAIKVEQAEFKKEGEPVVHYCVLPCLCQMSLL